jgi:threonine dehydrogenase-like Zn-dependent dehydrogenase
VTSARAIVLEEFGSPLKLAEFPVPAPEPGGLVVLCRYGGICGTDLHLAQGHLDVPTPLVLGHEGLGVVHALGEGTATDSTGRPLAIGDTVMWASSISCGDCPPCRESEPTLCEHRRTYGVNRPTTASPQLAGSWAEAICLEPGTTVVALPDCGIDPIAAMSLACAGPTMVHALQRRPVRAGETVVVQGSGPVGLAACALSSLAGAEVILVGGPTRRLAAAAAAGFGDRHLEVVDSGDVDGAVAEVFERTGGRGADLVIECTGVPAAIDQGLRMTRRAGAYLVVGQYTDSGDAWINPHRIVHRQLDVVGSWAFTGDHLIRYVELLPELTARFDLAALVTRFPLDEVDAAMTQVAAGDVLKAVLAGG